MLAGIANNGSAATVVLGGEPLGALACLVCGRTPRAGTVTWAILPRTVQVVLLTRLECDASGQTAENGEGFTGDLSEPSF
jgi:hypothetical protein